MWGPVERWGDNIKPETAKDADASEIDVRLMGAYERIRVGRLVLGYLSRVMEGSISVDAEECRDLYLQGVLLACEMSKCMDHLEAQVEMFRDSVIDG